MAFRHLITVSDTVEVQASTARLVEYLSSMQHMRDCMPKLDELCDLGDEQYFVRYHPMGPDGYQFVFSFLTRVKVSEDTIHFMPIKDKRYNAIIDGRWQLNAIEQDLTKITLHMDVELEVPVSRFLKPVAAPIIAKIFTRLIQRYAENIAQKCILI